MVDLRVDGSLIVESDSVMGQPEPALPVGSNAIRPRDQQLANTDIWYTLFPMLPRSFMHDGMIMKGKSGPCLLPGPDLGQVCSLLTM